MQSNLSGVCVSVCPNNIFAVNNLQPTYMCRHNSQLVVPRTLSSYGDRTFAAAGPRLWNSLPVQLCNHDITYGLFQRKLKGHLFGTHEHGAL